MRAFKLKWDVNLLGCGCRIADDTLRILDDPAAANGQPAGELVSATNRGGE